MKLYDSKQERKRCAACQSMIIDYKHIQYECQTLQPSLTEKDYETSYTSGTMGPFIEPSGTGSSRQYRILQEQRELITIDNMPTLLANFYDQEQGADQGAEPSIEAETSPTTTVD